MASKTQPSGKREVILLQLSVKSEHPNVDTVMLLRQIDAAQPELKRRLASHVSVKDVSIQRRGTLPIGLETAVISILVNIGTELSKDVAKALAAEAFAWLKDRWKDASFRKLRDSKISIRKNTKKAKKKSLGK